MAWLVSIILDTEYKAIARENPVWALETPERRALAPGIWASRNEFWSPEPSFTLFSAGGAVGATELLANILPTVLEHHPGAVCIDLPGACASQPISETMATLGFRAGAMGKDGLTFCRPLSAIENVPLIVVDAAAWQTRDAIYNSLFEALGAPAWHGRNLDALHDSIVGGGINRIDLPYRLRIVNAGDSGPDGADFVDFLSMLAAKCCALEVEVLA